MKRSAVIGVVAVVLGALAGCAEMSTSSSSGGWTTLLDGPKGFEENWTKIGAANWRIVDGVAQADMGEAGKNSFLMTKQAYGDFMLRAEFWVSDDANSGIYMRCPDLNDIADTTCTEANIFDRRPDPKYATGAITHLSEIKDHPRAGGKWNTFEITARGPRIVVRMNGVKTAETDKSHALRGNIGLQWAAGVVKFRKVEIRQP